MWKRKIDASEEVYFYGVEGRRPGTYRWTGASFETLSTNAYFAGKLVLMGGQTVFKDRLGSVRRRDDGGPLRYFAYGEEQTATGNEKDKFGTYYVGVPVPRGRALNLRTRPIRSRQTIWLGRLIGPRVPCPRHWVSFQPAPTPWGAASWLWLHSPPTTPVWVAFSAGFRSLPGAEYLPLK